MLMRPLISLDNIDVWKLETLESEPGVFEAVATGELQCARCRGHASILGKGDDSKQSVAEVRAKTDLASNLPGMG